MGVLESKSHIAPSAKDVDYPSRILQGTEFLPCIGKNDSVEFRVAHYLTIFVRLPQKYAEAESIANELIQIAMPRREQYFCLKQKYAKTTNSENITLNYATTEPQALRNFASKFKNPDI